jgi:anthranilate synthase component 1
MFYPTLEEIQSAAESGEYRTAPVSLEIFSDIKTPIEVIRILKNVSEHCYMLESISDNEKWGRYTFLGYDPKLEITCTDGKMKVGELSFTTTDPGKYIKQILAEHKSARFAGLPTFTGGLVGYFSYDYLKYAEPSLKLDAEDNEGFKDVDLMLFDKVIAFDNYRQKIVLIVNISLKNYETEYNRAMMELRQMSELIRSGQPQADKPGRMKSAITALFDQETYCGMVRQAQHHIREGDIYQIVLSNRLEVQYEGTLLNTYRVLRTVNPSPYMFYFSSSDMEVAGASPETLVKLENGVLHTFPLAGTRPRGRTEEEDKKLRRSCWQIRRSLPNIICWLISDGTTLVKSANLAVFQWKNTTR